MPQQTGEVRPKKIRGRGADDPLCTSAQTSAMRIVTASAAYRIRAWLASLAFRTSNEDPDRGEDAIDWPEVCVAASPATGI